MLSIIDLSKKILAYFAEKDEEVDLLKLQKLCYYIQAWYYTFYNKPLFEEAFIAMKKGPVSPVLQSEYQKSSGNLVLQYNWKEYTLTDSDTDCFIEIILDWYGDFSGKKLSDLTHTETPWIIASNSVSDANTTPVINLEDMRECYKKHSFYDVLSAKVTNSFSYKKYMLLDDRLILIDMDRKERATINAFVKELEISNKDSEIGHFIKRISGKIYEFFCIGHYIVLLTDAAKGYFMRQTEIKAEVKRLLEEKKVTYFWEYNDEMPFYAYTAPELGIAVSDETFEGARNNAVEEFLLLKDSYSLEPCCVEDQYEKSLIDKVFSLYKANVTEFYNLLGLNKNAQLQGEKIDAE